MFSVQESFFDLLRFDVKYVPLFVLPRFHIWGISFYMKLLSDERLNLGLKKGSASKVLCPDSSAKNQNGVAQVRPHLVSELKKIVDCFVCDPCPGS